MYKLVRVENGIYKTLFHGVNGSRALPVNEWLEARVTLVRDGGGKRYYQSGWHVLRTAAEAQRYLRKFKRRDGIVIVACEVEDTWRKEHSPFDVVLARRLRITGPVFVEADNGSERTGGVGS